MYQENTRVGRIARRQTRLGGFVESPSPSLEASEDEDDGGDSSGISDKDEASDSSSDDAMTSSQWLSLCHSWQKREIVLGMRVVMYLGGELVIGDIFVRRSVYSLRGM